MRRYKVVNFLLICIILSNVFLLIYFSHNDFSLNSRSNSWKSSSDQTYNKASQNQNFSKQWLDNPNFSSPIEPIWYSYQGGDVSDIGAADGLGQADITVIGSESTFSIVSDPPTSTNWHNFTNPDFPMYPMAYDGPGGNDGQGIDSYGCWAIHEWDENGASGELGQTPSVHWKRNVSTPVNMSDYEITEASVSAVVNASVLQNVDCPGDTASGGTDGSVVGAVYDYVKFYILVSDLPEVKEYEIAHNKTTYLGLGNAVFSTSTMGDTFLVTVPEEELIFYLTSVLGTDYHNFTITLGMLIYCEDDDVGYELDTWSMLRIKSFNLTFTYQKKVNRYTYANWNQIGDELPSGNIQVDQAKLFFQHKISENWTQATDSPNSEIRILINNNTHIETIKLSTLLIPLLLMQKLMDLMLPISF